MKHCHRKRTMYDTTAHGEDKGRARTVDLLRVPLKRRHHAPSRPVEEVHVAVHAGRRHHRVARGARVDRQDAGLRGRNTASAAADKWGQCQILDHHKGEGRLMTGV